MRVRLFFALVLALCFVPAATAHAKGASAATIDGAGLAAPIVIEMDGRAEQQLPALADETDFFDSVYGQTPTRLTRERPAGALGPMLTIDWTLPTSATTAATIRQEIYPYAEGGALVYTPPGQATHPETTPAVGGWYRASSSLPAFLQRLGVPDQATLEQAIAAASTPAPSTPSPSSGRPAWMIAAVVAGALAVAALATTAGVTRATRRRTRVAAT